MKNVDERESSKWGCEIHTFRGSTMAVRLPVKEMVVGSSPTPGAVSVV